MKEIEDMIKQINKEYNTIIVIIIVGIIVLGILFVQTILTM